MQPLIDELKKIGGEYEKLKENYLEDAKGENRADIESKVKILESKKWLQEQKPAIIEEVTRLTKLERIQEAKRKKIPRHCLVKKENYPNCLLRRRLYQDLIMN